MTRAVTLAEIADGAVLTVDSSNSRIGIGSTQPTAKLDVTGDGNVSGTLTATSFSGDGTGLTGVASTDNIITGTAATFTGGIVAAQSDVSVRNLTGVAATFTGVLTYEDVTNVDSVGVVTARSGIEFGASGVGGTITATGQAEFVGVVTATGGSFTGDVNIADKIVHIGDTNTAIRFAGNDIFAVETAGAERLRIDSTGQILAGHTADISGGGLQVSGSSNAGNAGFHRFDNNDSGPFIQLLKSRNGTVGSNTVVQSGDELGTLNFQGADGTDFHSAARVVAKVDGTPGNNDMPGRLEFHTTDDGSGSPVERVRIDKSGKVGINSTAPLTQLDVNSGGTANGVSLNSTYSGGPNISFRVNGTIKNYIGSGGGFSQNGDADDLALRATDNIMFDIDGSEKARITNQGRVRINRTSNLFTEQFLVESDTTTVNPMTVSNTRSSAATDYAIIFGRNGSIVGSIQTSLSATSYITSSDHRLKENVVDISDGITRVKQLQPKRFNFIADADTAVDGFLAHEAQTVVPEAVTGTHNEVDNDGNAVMQGIDQSKLVPLLTAALQEAIAKIETLETKVAALEARLTALEGS